MSISNENQNIPEDYYLLKFTKKELIDLVSSENEWSDFDVELGKRLLKEMGGDIAEKEIEDIKFVNQIEEKEPQYVASGFINLWYVLSFIVPFISVVVGHSYWKTKTKLSNGEKVFTYDTKTKKHGKNIFTISALLLILIFLVRSAYAIKAVL